jgi:hypothetical protein
MSTPHNHHFIPAFFLKQWAGPDGKLVEYSIKHEKVIAKRVGPNATGYEYDLYAFPDLPAETAQFIEQKFFDYTDRTASKALELHLANADRSAWSVELISAWSRFVIALHLRHPDAMPELRTAAQSVWDGSGIESQRRYEEMRKPGDPATFDEYIALRDPLVEMKMRVNLIIKSFDNDILGKHINNMRWAILDVSSAGKRLLMSDRSVVITYLNQQHGYITLPVGPTKLFLAVNDKRTLDIFRRMKPAEIVRNANKFNVTRARRFVWAHDEVQTLFVRKNMSKAMEPLPLLPNIGWKGKNPLPDGSAIPPALYTAPALQTGGRIK